MLKTFINRPVLSTVISIILVMLGILGLIDLPVTQYPDIAPPTVQVRASYPGANAETIIESVINPLEEEINGVEGMTYITSTASNDGSAEINIFFEQEYDPDIAAVNVQNRVSRANAILPDEVVRSGIVTKKRTNSALVYISVFSENPEFDDTFVQNYLNINVKPELERVNGVADVNVFGGKDYSMRVWLNPNRMANYGLNADEVIAAIREQSIEAAAGSLGQNAGEAFEYVIKYKGRYKSKEEYENIIIKAFENGDVLRLKDVADVELDAFSYTSKTSSKGNPGMSFGVFQTPGSNAQEIIEKLYVKLDELKADFPEGMDYMINFDTNKFLTASIDKVKSTLIQAFLLVFVVVFIFLQDFKTTLIPAIAVPVSLIGTFFFMNLLGYSLNLLTLFALVLAIGIVVDDAIVVAEAVYAKLEEGYTSAKQASIAAMGEISGAIISTTLVMAAVFVPVTFIKGPAGVFYEQFGVTLIIAIFISSVNALTLSPALCAIFLKPKNKRTKKSLLGWFYKGFNSAFNFVKTRYLSTVRFFLRRRWLSFGVLGAFVAFIIWANNTTPKGFVPTEDRGVIFMNVELPVGATLDRTFQATNEIYESIKDIKGVRNASITSGRNFFAGSGSSYGQGFVILEPWENRTTDETSSDGLIAQMKEKTKHIADAEIIFFTPSSVPGYGSADGFEVQLVDRKYGDLKDLDNAAKEFVAELNKDPRVGFASNSFNTDFPQYQLEIDVEKTKISGIGVNDIITTMQSYIGGFYVSNFNRFGKQFRVFVQAYPDDRRNLDNLNSIFVKTGSGEMAPISEFVSLHKVYGPQTVKRFNLYNAVAINGSSSPQTSSGEAIQAVRDAAKKLPNNYDIDFSGITREEISAGGQAVIVFLLSVIFAYFFLAAQYESYLLPFSVILSLPIGVGGAYLVTILSGLQNNIYFQIALVMLVGLLAKNAILIVEFGIQRRRQGYSIAKSAIDAGKIRLRPILMTSLAFVLGLLPLVLAQGVGAKGNQSIGTGAAGGLLIGTLVGVLIVPTLFAVFQALQEKITGKPEFKEPTG
ncbi:MAG: efflux RND transporter permease subunit [Bacteroidota bacterium]